MKNILHSGLTIIFACISAVLLFTSTTVFAANGTVTWEEDTSGNIVGAGNTVDLSQSGTTTIGNEFLGAGRSIKADYVIIDGSAYIAGQNITAQNSVIGGSLVAAGQDLIISSEVDNNIIVAGQNINTGSTTKARALLGVAATTEISGTFDYVSISADTIYFNASVTGDVKLSGSNVYIGENAVVNGKLTIEYTNEQDINTSASINEISSTLVEQESSNIKEAATEITVGALIFSKIKKLFKSLLRLVVIALVFSCLLRSNLTEAYEMSTKRPGQYWGYGAATLLACPLAFLIFLITIVGIPVAELGLIIYTTGLLFAKAFTFSSLVRELIFRHTKKRLHPIAECVIAVLPAAIINLIPIIHGLVGFACALYTMGYITLVIVEKIKKECKKVEA